ncbi:MAG: hypothetical protein QOE58_3609 [Actinomycetota bacterium]|jgi:hypothetical protein|nr:hypothetical protein [Actinomycetota bacterium]
MSMQGNDQDTQHIPRADRQVSIVARAGFAEASAREQHGILNQERFNRQKDEFGGVKIGSAFFGWLTATGTALLLTAVAAAAGTVLGVATNTNARTVTAEAAQKNPQTVGIASAIALLIVVFVSYYCGGYVAARMARFNGLTQGFAVWVWAVVIAAVVAILAAVAGSQYDVLSELNSFPRIPVSERNLTTGGTIALIVAAVGSLAGALLGGLVGMRFHRQVDTAILAK